jgi:hypothetical protein
MFASGFVVGAFAGGMLGILVAAMCVAAKDRSRWG